MKHSELKRLRPSAARALRECNDARLLAGLEPLRIKPRRCLACRSWFESIGSRTCGCAKLQATYLGGREVVM